MLSVHCVHLSTSLVPSARGTPQSAVTKKGSSLKQSQLTVTNDGALKVQCIMGGGGGGGRLCWDINMYSFGNNFIDCS